MSNFLKLNLVLFCFVFAAAARVYLMCDWKLSYCFSISKGLYKARNVDYPSFLGWFISPITNFSRDLVYDLLPSPHGELLLGMVLGINDLKKVPEFMEVLRNTGTMHVVVVSGYNINLIYTFVIDRLGSRYMKRNIIVANLVCLFYSLVSGFGPPVVRAMLMNLVLSWSTYYGKPNEVLRVVLMSGAVMIVFEPYILFSLSFILSFLATLSLVLFGNTFDFITNRFEGILGIFIKDFFTTINAQILVWPVISMSFGSLSLISPMANALVLWTVPIITILGSLLLLVGLVVKFAASMLSYPIYFIISFFVVILENCSRINVFSYSISYFRFNVDITTSLYYYLGLLVLLIFKSKIKELIEKAVVYLKIKIG